MKCRPAVLFLAELHPNLSNLHKELAKFLVRYYFMAGFGKIELSTQAHGDSHRAEPEFLFRIKPGREEHDFARSQNCGGGGGLR